MKKTTTLLTLVLLFAISAFAGPVDPERALETANEFWGKVSNAQRARLKLSANEGLSKSSAKEAAPKNDAQYYMFVAEGGNGFVIVSGDDCLEPVVGYSTTAAAGEMPAALEAWLEEYSCYVDDVRAGVVEPSKTKTATGKRIEPMLQTTWNQGAPYNNKCPEVNGQKTPTGCTATAMAQIMKFHEWPVTPTANATWKNNITGATETVHLKSRTYDWSKMLNHYRNGYTAEQADAVAQLMVDVGKAIGSTYALEGTGSSNIYAAYALVNYFGYTPEITVVRRTEYTDEEYYAIIRENLEARQPLMYTGHSQSYTSGHAFVCDGIDENNMLHIDWGWDGAYNGFFDMTYMEPAGTGIGGGDGRYNVGQALVANIRPRTSDESDMQGVPVVYMMDVIDVNSTTTLYEQTNKFNASTKQAKIKFVAGLLNWSHSAIGAHLTIAYEKDGEIVATTTVGDPTDLAFNNSLGYYVTQSVSCNPKDDNYLEEGQYRVLCCYTDDSGDIYIARGAENGLLLDVTSTGVTLSKELPEVEVTDVMLHDVPQLKGDRVTFDAKFKTNNGKSATVLLVPYLNKKLQNGTYKSVALTTLAALIQVHDEEEMFASFNTGYAVPEDGEYHISFKYNLKNEYTDRKMDVESGKLFNVQGASESFVVEPLPSGAVPMVEALTARSVTLGKSMNIAATVKNIASTNDALNAVLGIMLENVATGEKNIVQRYSVEDLKSNATVKLEYKVNDYCPVLLAGDYNVYVCMLQGGAWEKIKHSAEIPCITINETTTALLYADSRIEINNGNKVRQGTSFNTTLKLKTVTGDFEGYVRVNNTRTTTTYMSSEHIPVSIKEGESVEVTISAYCEDITPLGEYRININYYDTSKKSLGVISNNTVTYAGNGNLWVADITAVEDVLDGEARVVAGEGCIAVDGAVTVSVYGIDGRTIYSGDAAVVVVEKGIYVVCATDAAGNVSVVKVFVK